VTDRELRLRRYVFDAFARLGEPPPIRAASAAAVESLERQHVLVMRDGRVHMAHPFAGHRDGTRVEAPDGRVWWGNCAWDGLGIVAALGLSDATLTSDEVTVRVRAGQVVDDALFHIEVPARHWWDDIEFT
jgi:hypothetical protein